MPYKSFWYRENRIVFTEVIGDFSTNEMISLNRQFNEVYFAPDQQNPIHLIADIRAMSTDFENLALIRDITKQVAMHPALGWVILVGYDDSYFQSISKTIFQLLGVNCKLVQTLDEAEKTLEQFNYVNIIH